MKEIEIARIYNNIDHTEFIALYREDEKEISYKLEDGTEEMEEAKVNSLDEAIEFIQASYLNWTKEMLI